MFRHVVMFRFIPETTAEQRQAAVDGLRSLPAQIPQLLDYRVGFDAGLAEDNFEFAVVVDLADQRDYEVYRDHPAHQAVIASAMRPIIATRAAVQYEC